MRPTARKARHHDDVRAERKGVPVGLWPILQCRNGVRKPLLEARIWGLQCSNQEREGVLTGRDRKSREDDPGDLRNGGFGRGQAL